MKITSVLRGCTQHTISVKGTMLKDAEFAAAGTVHTKHKTVDDVYEM